MKRLCCRLTALAVLAAMPYAAAAAQQQPAADQDDVAMLSEQTPLSPIRHDGTAALYLLPYHTENQHEINRLFRQYRDYLLWNSGTEPAELAAKKLPDPQETPTPCGQDAASCLQSVADHLPAWRTWQRQHRQLLSNIQNLTRYDGFVFHDFLVENLRDKTLIDMRFPPFHYVIRQRFQAALSWQSGQKQQAVNQICTTARIGRTLQNSQAQNLLSMMISLHMLKSSADMLAVFIRQQPDLENRLPEQCGRDLTPDSARSAAVLCSAVKGEFAFQQNHYRLLHRLTDEHGKPLPADLKRSLLPESGRDIHETASYYAQFCGTAAAQTLAQDQAFTARVPAGTAAPDFVPYARALQDGDMVLRAFQAALQLARLPAAQRAAQRHAVLTQWQTPSRRLTFRRDTQTIAFTPYRITGYGYTVNSVATVAE